MDDHTDNRHLVALAQAVMALDIAGTKRAAQEALQAGVPPMLAISQGLANGMRSVGEKFSCGEFFVPEILVASRALYAGMGVLTPHLPRADAAVKPHIVMGVVSGDIHDIGKNIVKLFWESAGYRVIDAGKNVAVDAYLAKIREHRPMVLALSTLMTTTLRAMEQTISSVRRHFEDTGIKIVIGGASVTEQFARNVGADFYGKDGPQALSGLRRLIGDPL